MDNIGLHIILEQNLQKFKDWLENQSQDQDVQDALSIITITTEESRNCTICKDKGYKRKYSLKNSDDTPLSAGVSFNNIYFKKGGSLVKLEDEIKKLLKDDILYDVDTSEPPLDGLSQDEKDRYLDLNSSEEKILKHACYLQSTLIKYIKDSNSNEPKKAANYWKKLCAKFKVKYNDEVVDSSGGSRPSQPTTVTQQKIYGCFDSTSEVYYCKTNECPGDLDDSDFDNASNRVTIGDITYIHTGCTYTKEIVLDNTYVFENPPVTFEAGSHTATYRRPNAFKRISKKIEGMSLLGEYPPITNVKGFYGNEFTGEHREDLNKALILMLSRHCAPPKPSLSTYLTIYEGNAETTPLGQVFIETAGDGTTCLDNFESMRVYDDGETLKIRLKQLMLDELDQESGSQHRIPKANINAFNGYIDQVFDDYNVEDDIIVDRNGKLQLEGMMGLSKILENKPIGLEKILK